MGKILGEMSKQLDKIISAVNKYLLVRNDRYINESLSSSSDEVDNKIKNKKIINS